jgi:dihydrofolate reductase
MRNVIYGGATSLDGFLARPDGAVDWLMWSDEAASIMRDHWKRFDTMLMGRKTYEVALAQGHGGASPGIATYIFSRTLTELPAGLELVRDHAVDVVRRLKEQPGKDICLMGGGELAHSLFVADLIDEVGFNIHPVLLGEGIPALLPMKRQINLELIESRPFKNGCVYAVYRVKR